jgi:hypothetical protein
MMGLGQGNKAEPPLWIQLSVVLVNVIEYPHIQAGHLILTCIQVGNHTYQVTIISFVPFPY